MTVAESVKWLKENDNFLILTHVRPDGDTIGSACALCYALRKIGKKAGVFNNPQFSDAYPWITAPYIAPENFEYEHVIACDMADSKMFPKGFEGEVELCYDHHPSNTLYAKNAIIWGEKASCGELIMEVVKKLCRLDQIVADLLYVAVSTDTGCFVYGNTTGDTHRAAAELCDAGAANTYLNKVLFRTSSKERLLLEGLVFSSLRFYHEGRTVFAVVTREMMQKAGATEKDCSDLASLAGRVEGANTSITVKETEEGFSKVSVRTNGIVNANEVCRLFGGGGHAMAAGCSIEKSVDEAVELLADAVLKVSQ